MELQSLGYLGLRAKSLDDWTALGPRLFGLELTERTRDRALFRMDDRAQRIAITADSGGGISDMGFEVADATALDRLAARLEAHGVKVAPLWHDVAAARAVTDGIVFADPAGNRLEAFYGAALAATPFRPGRAISGFRTGALGMGHIVLNVARLDPMLAFYRDLLGFRISDYILRPFRIYFLHLNARHHSIALLESGQDSVHHIMIETLMLDDVGQGYDLAVQEDGRVATTFGRHINDQVTSFYSYTPSGFMLEYGWGGRSIDVANWTASEVVHGPSMWGHERNWLRPEARAEARAMRLRAAAEGVRAPVNVLAGHYAPAKE